MSKVFTPNIKSKKGKDLTKYVAKFIYENKYKNIPKNVIELAKKHILDGFGLALSGSVARTGKYLFKHIKKNSAKGKATVIGSSMKLPSQFAALANGVGIHSDDYDDTQLAVAKDRVYGLLTHPTAPCLPSALAEGEIHKINGKDFLNAYLIGVDVECKISEAMSPRHYQHGFHSTATCGTFASAAAASKIRKYSFDKTLRSIGIAASLSAGLRENFGTMTKPLHAGRAAESGVIACDLTDYGWSSTDKILESPRGFFQAHGGGYDIKAIKGKLGRPWTFSKPGISIKPHPCGSLTHPGMTKMLELIKKYNIMSDQVLKVDVGTNHNMQNALIHHRPTNEFQAKFSMEYSMAILLIEKRAYIPEYQDKRINKSDVQKMLRKVNFYKNKTAEAAGYDKMTTLIDIYLKNGKKISGRGDFGKGSPAIPMTYDEVADKFLGCAEFAKWPILKSKKIIKLVKNLENIRDIRILGKLLSK